MSLYAQTNIIWTGSKDSDWGEKKNWFDDEKPDKDDEIATFNGTGANDTSVDIDGGKGQKTGGVLLTAGQTDVITFTGSKLEIKSPSGITNASSATHRFNNEEIKLKDEQTWSTTGTGGLIIDALLDLDRENLNLSASSGTVITLNGEIEDSGDITKTGTGTAVFAANNSYEGTTTVNNGILSITNAGGLGDDGDGTLVNTGGTLQVSGDINIGTEALTLNGPGFSSNGALRSLSGNNTVGGNITLGSATEIQTDAGTLTLSGDIGGTGQNLSLDGSGDTTISGVIGTTTGTLTKTGAGTVTLSAANTYTGDSNVNAGTLVISNQTASANTNVASGAVLEFNVAGGTRGNSTDTKITGSGIFEKTGTGTLQWTNTTVEFALDSGGLIDISSGTLVGGSYADDIWTNNLASLNVDSGATFQGVEANVRVDALTGAGNIRSGWNGAGYQEFTFGVDDGSGLFSGVLGNSFATGNFVKTGSGTQILSGNNTFTGTMAIEGGRLVAASDTALGTTAAGTRVDSGAQLQLASANIGNEALTLNGAGISSDGALQALSGTNSWSGSITLASNSEINAASGANLALSGAITGSGRTLTVDGAGDTTLTGTNTYSTFNKEGAGNLTLGASNILDNGMGLNVAGGTFTMASGINDTIDQFNVSAGNLNIDGILTMNGGTLSGGDGAGSTGELILTAGNTLNITNDFDFGGTLALTAGTTLALSGGHIFDLGELNITGNSVIDFGDGSANTLNLGSLTIDADVTLITIRNWISFQDLWTTDAFAGATIDVSGGNTAKIQFTGFQPADTIWLTEDFGSNEITVPEPSSYGAILMGFGLVAWTLHRPRRSHHE